MKMGNSERYKQGSPFVSTETRPERFNESVIVGMPAIHPRQKEIRAGCAVSGKGDSEKDGERRRRGREERVPLAARPRSGLLRIATSSRLHRVRLILRLLARTSAVNRFFLRRLIAKNEEKRGTRPRGSLRGLLRVESRGFKVFEIPTSAVLREVMQTTSNACGLLFRTVRVSNGLRSLLQMWWQKVKIGPEDGPRKAEIYHVEVKDPFREFVLQFLEPSHVTDFSALGMVLFCI